jgi:hypothetical protein
LQFTPKRFGLAGSLKGRAAAFFDQRIQAIQYIAVCHLPMLVILPGLIGKDDFHG